MTRWTPTEPRALRQVDDVTELRALIVAALDAIAGVLPMLDELTDTRQPGLGVTTRRTETIRSQHRARELAARYPTRRADGSLIAVGQRGLVRSDSVVTMPGTRPVPVNLSAVSIADEITMEVAHLCQRIRRRLIAAGVCHIKRPADNPTPQRILAEARDLVPVVASRELLLDMARTLAGVEGLADRACTIALGPDRVDHPRPCPHCRHRSLVVHIEAGVTRCEGTHRCVCRDSYCPCHRDRTHHHQWRRDAPTKDARKGWRGRRESWDGLTREQDLADRLAAAGPIAEGAPTVTRDNNPELHRIVVERDENGEPDHVRFVCDGGDDASCHHYPACGCETWTQELHGVQAGQYRLVDGHLELATETIPPQPGHENVQQQTCWIDPWFNEAIGHDPVDWVDAWNGRGNAITVDDLHDGSISITFEGEYMTWEYADAPEAVHQ